MRVLLTSNASYDPPRGGSTRSNLAWLRHLSSQGHSCEVVSPTLSGGEDRTTQVSGVVVHGVRDLSFRASVLGEHLRRFQPDWVLVSSEDVSHVLLREAAKTAPGRVVYLAHTPQFYPFGPESWHPDKAAAEAVKAAAAVVVIGSHMAGYVREHLGREAVVVHPPMYGKPPYQRFGRFGGGFVLLINPCAVKGISIFLALAERFPEIEFAALTGWGTSLADRTALSLHANTVLLQNVADIEEVLAGARVLLMPSLWYEGFGLIAMEAMLRGVPVIASDSGGLKEAKEGTGYVIPVRPVTRYEQVFDDTLMPRAVTPEQDVEPWARALDTLLHDEAEYRREAECSRQVALRFVSTLDIADFERMLVRLPAATEPVRAAVRVDPLQNLDAAKRALLLARMKAKQDGR